MPFSLRQARAVVPFAALTAILCGQVQRAVGLGGGAAPAPPAPTEPPELQPTLDALATRIDTLHEDRRDVADTAWHLLMMSAARQSLRVGPHRNSIKTAAAWLRNVQDAEGRLAPNGEPCGRTAQLLAALAIGTAQRDANYKLLLPTSTKATAAALTAAQAEPELSGEETVLVAMLAELLREQHGEASQSARTAADIATRALARLPLGRSRRTEAAAQLTRLLLGESHPADLTVALCWPGDLRADPWHTVIGALAVQRLGAATRRAQWPVAERMLAERGADGLWPTAPGQEQPTTNAMLAMALALVHVPEPRAAGGEPQAERGR